MNHKFTILVLALGLALCSTPALAAVASVPNLISFQGFLTDTAGTPVANGAYDVDFRIYNVPVGGAPAWTELTSQSVTGGRFTHNLGSITPFLSNFFQFYDSLFLSVTVEGELITPRIRLTSAPFARLSGNLEVKAPGNDSLVVDTDPVNHALRSFGTDGGVKSSLWSGVNDYGILYHYDADGSLVARLAGNNAAGGELNLYQEDGTAGAILRGGSTLNGSTLVMYSRLGSATLQFDADTTGNTAVILPSGSLSDLEMADEPGVASDTAYNTAGLALSGVNQNIGLRSLTAPTAGYVLVLGTCNIFVTHTNGATSSAQFGVSNVSLTFPANQDGDIVLPSGLPSGGYQWPVTMQRIFSVAAGVSTFYLVADEDLGDWSIFDMQLSVLFFPTAYGIVNAATLSGASDLPDYQSSVTSVPNHEDVATEQAQAALFDAERVQKELEELQAEQALVSAKLKMLQSHLEEELSQPKEVE